MLTFKRPLKAVVPNHKTANVEKILAAVMHSENPAKAVAAIRKTRRFVLARMNGKKMGEAKTFAGIGLQNSGAMIMKEPIAKIVLDELLELDPLFCDKGMVNLLREMWECEDDVYNEWGKHVGVKPNWDVRKFAFNNVVDLRGYRKKDDSDRAPQATQIVFNVTPIPSQPVAIEIPAEK